MMIPCSSARAEARDALHRRQRDLRQIGTQGRDRAGGAASPHLHDLRHTFAVRALSDTCRTGRSRSGAHMVALSTYMGHVNIYATYWYLEATADLMRDVAAAGEQFLGDTRRSMTRLLPSSRLSSRHAGQPAGRQSTHAGFLRLELPAALRVRREKTEGPAIGADVGAA